MIINNLYNASLYQFVRVRRVENLAERCEYLVMDTIIRKQGIENVYASNWCIIYFCRGDLGNLSFNEMSNFIINEFPEADIIKIKRDEEIIGIHFPSPYSCIDVLRKTDQCRYQVIIGIDIEEETNSLMC